MKKVICDHKPFLLSVLLVLGIQMAITVVVYQIFTQQERNDKRDLLESTNNTLYTGIVDSSHNFVHDLAKEAGFFHQIDRYLTPDNFRDIIRTDLSVINVQSHRWIPFVNGSDRVEFEAFYSNIYENFSIRDIDFVDGKFIVNPAPERDFYYPFALSDPLFTLAPMGGDFYTNSEAFLEILNSPVQPSFSSRVRLSRPNADTDYGIFLQYFSQKEDGQPSGVIQNLVVYSEVIDSIVSLQSVNRTDFDMYIYDERIMETVTDLDDAMIFREPGSSPIHSHSALRELIDDFHVYTVEEYPFLFVFHYKRSYTKHVETDLPVVILASFIVLSFLINLMLITGYVFYRYRVESMKNMTYKEMLNFINHELRNPLNAMIGSVVFLIEKLKHTDIDNDYLMEKLLLCESQCNLMVYIIDRVKGMKMLIEGKNLEDMATLRKEEFTLEQLVLISNTIIRTKLDENGYVEYNTRFKCDPKTVMYSDRNRLTEVLLNILDNAIKYSKPETPGSVVLTIDLEERGEGEEGSNIIFQVTDTGIGIPDGMKAKLFKPYSRVNANTAVSGSGLGLYYCKLICNKMNGDIEYQSTLNEGSVFTVTIPHVTAGASEEDDEFSILDMDLGTGSDVQSNNSTGSNRHNNAGPGIESIV